MKKTGFVVLGLILLLAVNVPAENQNRKENHKLSRNLLKMNEAVKQGLFSRQVFEKQAAHAMRQGKLQCIIGVEKFSDEVIQACKDAGVEIISTHELAPDLKNMTVRISDPAQLFPVAQLPEVLMVATEGIFKTSAGVARSQGIDAMNVDAATSTYGVDGTGIRVGVLSDSFFDTRNGSVAGGFLTGCDDQNTGDLPASLGTAGRIAAGLPIAAAAVPVMATLRPSLQAQAQTPQTRPTPELALRLRAWSAVLHLVAGRPHCHCRPECRTGRGSLFFQRWKFG